MVLDAPTSFNAWAESDSAHANKGPIRGLMTNCSAYVPFASSRLKVCGPDLSYHEEKNLSLLVGLGLCCW